MDYLTKLPQELRIQLLTSFDRLSDITDLLRASSVFSEDLRVFRRSINLEYAKRYGPSLIQDAVACITFPQGRPLPNGEFSAARGPPVEEHLQQWGAKCLPDPTRRGTVNHDLVKKIVLFYDRLWPWVTDYLSKATSDYLPRAYRRLPRWSFYADSGTQLLLQQDTTNFDESQLTYDQKCRIMEAFIRYELLCLAMRHLSRNSYVKQRHRQYMQLDQHCYMMRSGPTTRDLMFNPYWDGDVLEHYEGKSPTAPRLQLIPCVHQYIVSLYEATFMDSLGVLLPTASHSPNARNEDHRPMFIHLATRFLPLHQHFTYLLEMSMPVGLKRVRRDISEEMLKGFSLTQPWVHAADEVQVYYLNYIRLHQQRAGPLFEGTARPGPRLITEDEHWANFGPPPIDYRIEWDYQQNKDTTS